MQVINTVQEMRAWSALMGTKNQSVGLVPTQGCLHDGHASLLKSAKKQCDHVVLSVFVNPLQFRKDGYEAYPRRLEQDLDLGRSCAVDAVFCPAVAEMYPKIQSIDQLFELQDGTTGVRDHTDFSIDYVTHMQGMQYVRVPQRLVMRMDGKQYPWHFDGVATVVRELFAAVRPTYAFFGQKDIQQFAILDALNTWIGNGIEVVPVPVQRDRDGVSSSSRLVLLNAEQRQIAAAMASFLHQIVETKIGVRLPDILDWLEDRITSIETYGNELVIDSIECVDPHSLDPHDRLQESSAFYIAYLINGIRLAETRRCIEEIGDE